MFFSNASFERPERHRMAQGWEKGAKGDAKVVPERRFLRKLRLLKMLVSQ